MMPNEASALWLYGSTACGRADSRSDLDVLHVTDAVTPPARPPSTANNSQRVSVSSYSWSEIADMARQGSLFLLHLRLEGRPIYEGAMCRGRLWSLIRSLPPYARVEKDIQSFRIALDDIRQSIGEGGSIIWELSVLATLVRNASILGCYLAGNPVFGRVQPIVQLCGRLLFNESEAALLASLSSYQLYAVGRGPRPTPPHARGTTQLLDLSERLVRAVEDVRHDGR